MVQSQTDPNPDSFYDGGFFDVANGIVETRIRTRVSIPRMREILREFDIPPGVLRRMNKRKLAACLAQQLLCETDDEDEGGEEEEEGEEEGEEN